MTDVKDGQCGLCKHFGEHHSETEILKNIRRTHHASAEFIDECGHPQHADLHLKVTPVSGCDGFEPARKAGSASIAF